MSRSGGGGGNGGGGAGPAGNPARRRGSIAAAILAGALLAGASLAQPEAEIDLKAARGNRRVTLDWSASPEAADSLFGGYDVWRSTSPEAASFILLRRFQRRYPVSWTYTRPDPRRQFIDPDSVIAYRKVQLSAQGDSAVVRNYIGVPPFNGFPYFYAVVWTSECLSALNDTVVVPQPQPEIFPFLRGGQERFGFVAGDDTLEVTRVPCRRIDPRTNRPVGDTTFVYQGTVESEEALRHHAIEATRLRSPIFPASTPRSNLRAVAAIPNPYVSSAPWDQPGERKIQFINLTEQATVRIFTIGADLVRVLEHPAPGSADDQGSIDWDLKNADGRFVESGIYIYQVETPGGVADVQGRLVIVR